MRESKRSSFLGVIRRLRQALIMHTRTAQLAEPILASLFFVVLLTPMFFGPTAASSTFDAPTLPSVPNGPSVPTPPGVEKAPSRGEGVSGAPQTTYLQEGEGRYDGMVLIPQGSFDMGSPEGQGRVDERPLHKVTLRSFWIGKREVAVREYCEFLDKEGAITKEGLPRINLENPDCPVIRVGKKRFRPKPDHETKPITQVSWHGAVDYAAWAGGRLPTSAEWEKAALLAGGVQPSDSKVVFAQEGSEPTDKEDPAGRQIVGMAGNVWEWCADWYAKDYYATSPASDPSGPALGEERVIRGGSWASTEASQRPKNRHRAPPLGCYRTVGFRIVKD